MSSFKIYRVVTLVVSSPHNFVSGSTAAPSPVVAGYDDKGVEVTFQNQSTGATNIWIGGSTMTISIGATSTVGAGGILIAQNGSYQIGKRHAPTAINMNDFWVASTSSNAIAVAHLMKCV